MKFYFSLIYFAEKDAVAKWSFMDSFWWGLMVLTTVGYGARAPHTFAGQVMELNRSALINTLGKVWKKWKLLLEVGSWNFQSTSYLNWSKKAFEMKKFFAILSLILLKFNVSCEKFERNICLSHLIWWLIQWDIIPKKCDNTSKTFWYQNPFIIKIVKCTFLLMWWKVVYFLCNCVLTITRKINWMLNQFWEYLHK